MSGITPGWGSQWETLVNAINSYYGGGVSGSAYQKVTNMLNTGDYTMSEMESILRNIPEFERTYNANGELIGVSYKATSTATSTAGSIAQEINSNAANTTTTQFQTVQTITKEAGSNTVKIGDDITKYESGTATTGKAIASNAIAALIAASVGISIGKGIDEIAYESGFNWLEWAGVEMEYLNPEVWGNIIFGENTFGANVFNMLLNIDPDTGNPQAYIDERAFAYMVGYMGATGFLDSTGAQAWDGNKPESFNVYAPIKTSETTFTVNWAGSDRDFYYWGICNRETYNEIEGLDVTLNEFHITSASANNNLYGIISSKEPFQAINTYGFRSSDMAHTASGVWGAQSYTFDNKTVYYAHGSRGETPVSDIGTAPENFTNGNIAQVAWLMEYGDYTTDGIPGVTNQPGSKVFVPTGISDFSDITAILNLLKNQYPELWDNRIEVSTDGENVTKYVPVGFPTGGTGDKPTTGGASQQKPSPDIDGDGENATDELIKTLIDLIQNPKTTPGMEDDTETPTQPTNPNPPDTGTGDTPTVIIPTGTAKSLFAIYNPEQSEIDSFGAWLWSPAFVDQLLKLFNDPMQSIIGLHKIFAPPVISGTNTIHVGYLDSGVSSKIVGEQYVTVSCGSVSLSEYFGNVFDYDPFTEVSIYLPFIGIERLNVGDVMRSSIEVVYHVDVITGACLAEIKVTRDLSGGTLYTYSGNCAVQYPISSGSYMGIVASIASIAGGVVGTIASGGALAPVALGAVNGVLGARTRVEHSGGFSGNAGAMGIKKPYLIISRPQTALAPTFPSFNGYPANESVILSQCSGFIRCDDVHLTNIPATSSELSEIESLLKDGVIL